jgi:hypothetical protein
MVYIPPSHSDRAVDVGLKRRQPDLSRHLSAEAKARLPNPIKSIWKVAQVKPGTINMGNGKETSISVMRKSRSSSAFIRLQVIRTTRCIQCAR